MNSDEDFLIKRLTEESRILKEAWMLRDEEPLTPDKTRDVLAEFNAYMTRVNKSQDWAARSMSIGPSLLSQVVSGSYMADPEKHIRAISKWLGTQYLKESAPRPSGWVRTRLAERIYAMAQWAQQNSFMVLVHGPAGVGKSITARAIAADTPGSIYIAIRSAGISKMAILEQLAAALRISGQKGTSNQLFTQIENRLKDTGRLLLVDEIHKLEGKRKDEALHTLRDLHDATGIPMLLLGMSNIAQYIQSGKSKGNEPLDQLHSRIKFWLDITEIATNTDDNGPQLATEDDIRKIIAGMKVRSPFSADAIRYLQLLACEYAEGAFRTVDTLVRLADAVAQPGTPISADMLRGIQRSRLGTRAAEDIDQRITIRMAKRKAG